MKFIIITLFCFSAVLQSCSDDPNVKHTNTQALAGEWFVTYKFKVNDTTFTDVGNGYSKIITSNTAENVSDKILITDYIDPSQQQGNKKSFKIKSNANVNDLTFSIDNSPNMAIFYSEVYKINITVEKGVIRPKVGHSKTGGVVDSIYMEMIFPDDTTALGDVFPTKVIVSGHKRTGFLEDEF